MNTATSSWDLRGWYCSAIVWLSLFAAAICFDLFGIIISMVMQLMFSNQQVEVNAGVVIGTIVGGLISFFIWGGLLTLPVWLRWKNAGRKQKNYIVWTCIQGTIVVVRGLVLAYSVLMIPAMANQMTGLAGALTGTQNVYYFFIGSILLSSITFLLWLSNTVLIPRKLEGEFLQGKAEQTVVPNH